MEDVREIYGCHGLRQRESRELEREEHKAYRQKQRIFPVFHPSVDEHHDELKSCQNKIHIAYRSRIASGVFDDHIVEIVYGVVRRENEGYPESEQAQAGIVPEKSRQSLRPVLSTISFIGNGIADISRNEEDRELEQADPRAEIRDHKH